MKKKTEVVYEDKQYRNFMILFYHESKHYEFNDVIFNLHGLKYYAYIKHQPDEEEKQEHYHAFIRLDSATTEERLAKRLGIPKEKVRYVKNVRSANRYLTHIDYPDKIQYSIDDVIVSGLWRRQFNKCFQDVKTEEEIIQDIYFFIDNSHFDTYMEKLKALIMFININCYDTVYKRYRLEFIDYLKMNL